MNEPDDTTTPPSRRLNPFAFPSETDQRFVLFTIAAVMWVLGWGRAISETSMALVLGSQTVGGLPLIWKLALPTAVGLVAIVLYLKHPSRIVRKQGLKPFDPTRDARLQNEVEHLSTVAGLKNQPRLMLRRANQTGGQAFGLRGAYVVRLDEGLRLVVRKAPPMFRAILLHELAHIANRDVGRTYFAQSLWSATLWVAIIPYLVIMVTFGLLGPRIYAVLQGELVSANQSHLLIVKLPTFIVLLVLFMVSVFMAYSIRASLLRVRETEADWRVAMWGAEHALRDILQRSAAATAQEKTGFRGRIADSLKLHPTAQDRLQSLQAPDQPFRIKPEIALFVGWLSATTLLGALEVTPEVSAILAVPRSLLTSLASTIDTVTNSAFLFLIGLALVSLVIAQVLIFGSYIVVSVTVIGSLGLAVLRETVADSCRGKRGLTGYGRLFMLALLFVLGLHLGIVTSSFGVQYLVDPKLRPFYLSFALDTFPIAIVFAWASLAGLRIFGGRLLGTHCGTRLPVARRRLLVIGFSAILAPLLFWFIWAQIVLLLSGPWQSFVAEADMTDFVHRWLGTLDQALSRFIFVFIIGFPFGWLVTAGWRRLRPPRCPQCRTIARQKHVLGKSCASCGADLAPWLFVS